MKKMLIALSILAVGCTDPMTEQETYPAAFTESKSPAGQHNILELFAEPLMEVMEEQEEYSNEEYQYYDQEYDYSAEEYETYYDEYEWEAYVEENYDEYAGEDYGPWSEEDPSEYGGVYDPETGLIDYGDGRYGAYGVKGWMAIFGMSEEEFNHLHDEDE